MQKILENQIRERARFRCEYCRLPETCHRVPFQIDHIIAEQHGGQTTLENLANSCLRCNKRKGPNIAGVDRSTGQIVRLFHPRRDVWTKHFELNGAEVVGLTPIGRATIATLGINYPTAIGLRAELIAEGLFPPE